jgi:hypothetical protein
LLGVSERGVNKRKHITKDKPRDNELRYRHNVLREDESRDVLLPRPAPKIFLTTVGNFSRQKWDKFQCAEPSHGIGPTRVPTSG